MKNLIAIVCMTDETENSQIVLNKYLLSFAGWQTMDRNLSDHYIWDWNYSSTYPFYDNITVYEEFVVQTQSVVFGVMLAIWATLLNLFVISSILYEKRTRIDVYFLQIMNMSLANIFIGVFVIPLTVYSILYPWELGEVLCKFWIIFDNLLPFASITTLVIMNIDRLILLTHSKAYKCLFQTCLKQIILMTPWMTSLVIVVPLWTHGALPYHMDPGECIIIIVHSAAVAYSVITYFVPLSMIIFITLKIMIVRIQTDRQYTTTTCDRSALKLSTFSTTEQPVNEPEERREKTVSTGSIASLCLANFIFCSMWFPYQFVTLLMTLCTSHLCMPSQALSQAVTWTATASAGVVPFVWFIDSKMRRSCTGFVCRAKTRDRDDLSEGDV